MYVPGGSFLAGGDPDAYFGEPRKRKETADVFVGKYEVTCSEYLEFLNDRTVHDPAKAFARAPRQAPSSGQYRRTSGERIVMSPGWERWPVFGISRDDAAAYCDRRSKRKSKTYRLPTSVGWEKATRGADGRFFPWGSHFDWSFTSGGESKSGERQPDKIGDFVKDESPYCVRNLGGSMREWCGDWENEEKGYARVRGGSWGSADVSSFRAATRIWNERTGVFTNFGFRLARVPGLR